MTGRAFVEASESLSLHTRDIDFVSTGALDIQSAEDVSVGGKAMRVSSEEGIELSAGTDVSIGAGDDLELHAAGRLSGRVAQGIDVVADSMQTQSAQSIDVAVGDGVTLSSGGDISASTADTLDISSRGLQSRVSGDLRSTVGGDALAMIGGDLRVETSGSSTAMFGDGLSVSGSSMVVEGGERLVGVAREVSVTGAESVRVGSVGSVVELSGDGGGDNVEYTMYVWRSSGSFDEYANVVPVMENAEELIVRSASPGGARAVSLGGMTVHLELQAAGPDGAWGQVWSSQLGAGSYSLDGLHIRFQRQDVVGVRLGSVPFGNPSFEGWHGAVLHFGRAVGAGSVSVSAAKMLELTSGQAVAVSTEAVSVSAGRSVEVRGQRRSL